MVRLLYYKLRQPKGSLLNLFFEIFKFISMITAKKFYNSLRVITLRNVTNNVV